MKINKILMGLGAVAALSLGACSNDEPANGTNPEDAPFGDQYLSVSILMPTANGGRTEGQADNDKDKYDQGTEQESAIDNVTFLFFDANDNVVDIQKFTDVEFTTPALSNTNPYVSSYGVKEVRLKAGLNYDKVAVILNTTQSVSDLRSKIKDLKSMCDFTRDYVAQIAKDGSNQFMSNSVYFNESTGEIAPSEEHRIILVKITEKNKYTSKERPNIDNLINSKEKAYVDVYVERAVARIDVKMNIDIKDFYVSKDENTKETTKSIVLFDNVNFTTREIEVVPVIEGMMLDVLTPTAKLIKPVDLNQIGYNLDNNNYNKFQWNDPQNRRSYWATTADFDKNNMGYFSWNQMANKVEEFSQYIHPNTQEFEPTAANEDKSKNTKVVVAATLKYKDGEELKELDLVQYGSEYMLADNLKAQTANLVNIAIRSINWANNHDVEGITFSDAEAEVLSVAVNNSFLGGTNAGLKPIQFDIVKLNSSEESTIDDAVDYEAKVVTVLSTDPDEKFYDINIDATLFDDVEDQAVKDVLTGDLDDLKERVFAVIDVAIEKAIAEINVPRILYWKGGKTYYYYVIRHQGFYGLAGNGTDDYVFGVVRNHIYNVSLEGIYGLGTPVINPGEPIDPERPSEQLTNYIKARINILPWRVVKNNATVH